MESNSPENSTIINVCIIPKKEVGDECVWLAQFLKSPATRFVLDGQTKFAHLTLWMARVDKGQISQLLVEATRILSMEKPFLCKHTGYFATAGRYYEVSYAKSAEFLGLQSRLVEGLKEFRLNPKEPYEEAYFVPYTNEQRKNAEETGYDLVGELYRPHITLARWHEGQVPKKLPELPVANLSFDLSTVCICLATEAGAVYKMLARHHLV